MVPKMALIRGDGTDVGPNMLSDAVKAKMLRPRPQPSRPRPGPSRLRPRPLSIRPELKLIRYGMSGSLTAYIMIAFAYIHIYILITYK